MPRLADLVGLSGAAVVILAVTVAAGRRLGLRRSGLARLAGLSAVAALLPIGGLPLCASLRGVAGDWSLTTLVLLLSGLRRAFRVTTRAERGSTWADDPSFASGRVGCAVLESPGEGRSLAGAETVDARSLTALQGIVTAGGLFLYPLTLGLGTRDPYRLGYGEPWFLAALAVVALTALVLDRRLVTFAVSLAVLAWAGGAGESRNLWDYLLDPLVFLWSLASLLRGGARALARGPRRAAHEPLRIRTGSSR